MTACDGAVQAMGERGRRDKHVLSGVRSSGNATKTKETGLPVELYLISCWLASSAFFGNATITKETELPVELYLISCWLAFSLLQLGAFVALFLFSSSVPLRLYFSSPARCLCGPISQGCTANPPVLCLSSGPAPRPCRKALSL